MVAQPGFRRSLSRAKLGSIDAGRMPHGENGEADERTGLLGRLENGDASHKLSIRDFFLNKSHTPGEQSPNKFVRASAQGWNVTKVTLFSNYVNILLVFVPLGMVAGAMSWNPTTVFILNFFAIVPLAALLSFATEEISLKLGQTMGGLLNATFGNAVELIVSIVALTKGEIRIVQSSMLGSILSNLLLVLGCCFLAGGITNTTEGTALGIEQDFNMTVASTMSSLLSVAAASLIIPATLYAALSKSKEATEGNILTLSHGTAIILLVLYVLYIFFQLKTHSHLFDGEAADNEEQEVPQMSPWAAGTILIVVTLLVAVCAEFLVDSIESVVETMHISKTFIGLILLPIVGNAAEHVTAIVVALKDKMDLAMGVAIGSSMQIALLVTPALVILGWIIGQPMTLHFETFETVVFFLSVLVVTYVLQDGKSNFLEGAMLLGLYFIIALAFLVYPDDASDGLGKSSIIEGAGAVVGM
ncbi:Sodium/calcium exchanger protein-domain-containing protein [Amylocarpus encephaloides]|uniref:Vacuolar calcium ion transporter n=1 Tax=Amylocarpus encephaloides TaxID=45428 RepID=A0A9P8C670_9HELO|nr:Sodium/calcium exchanger protein-domain-containing protein [Amylocarpus encephaloides]